MKSLNQYLVEFDNPQIYCDMDGVVADFLKFTRNALGGNKFRDKFWEDIPVDTFAQLDKMPDADVLWGYIKKFRPIMLTAAPRESRGAIAKRAPQAVIATEEDGEFVGYFSPSDYQQATSLVDSLKGLKL